jgi:hypothetical protein
VRHILDDPRHACASELGFAGATVVACHECSFLFKLQQPTAADLHEHYAESGEDYLESLAEEHSGIREDFRVARQLLTEAFHKGDDPGHRLCKRFFWNRSRKLETVRH